MAGDWIKMRGNLWDDPRVGRLCDLTDSTEGPVIGALYWLWATADQHTEDGCMPGLTLRQIDRKTGLPGFAAALVEIGWLRDDPQGVVIVKFDEHNGTSAKRRSMEAQRKATGRKLSASDADGLRTEEGQGSDALHRIAELEKELEKEKREKEEALAVVAAAEASAQSKAPKATQLPQGWMLPKGWGDWALSEFGWSAEAIRTEAAKFADYWHGKSGKDATKRDWEATWRNWCRNARVTPHARASPASTAERDAEARRLLGFSSNPEELTDA